MASFYNQIFLDDGQNGLASHGIYSVMIEYIEGNVTREQIKSMLDGSPESDADVDAIADLLDSLTYTEKYIWAIKFHSRLLATELRSDTRPYLGYPDNESFKTAMGY